jgi:hypothetical protein
LEKLKKYFIKIINENEFTGPDAVTSTPVLTSWSSRNPVVHDPSGASP